MFRFHTTQANERVSASTRKSKNFDPCACAYACVEAVFTVIRDVGLVFMLGFVSLVKTRLNSTTNTLSVAQGCSTVTLGARYP